MKRLAIPVVTLLLAGLAGCALEDEDKKSGQKPIRRVGMGGVFAGDIDDMTNVGGRRKDNNRQNNNPQVPGQVNGNRNPNVAVNDGGRIDPDDNPPPRFTEQRVAGKEGIVGVLTDRVLNYDVEIRKNPRLRLVRNKSAGGSDPFSVSASMYIFLSVRVTMLNFKKNLDTVAALNSGRYPTYKQYIDTKNQMRVRLAKLPRYRFYAYQEKTGRLVILEDPARKAGGR